MPTAEHLLPTSEQSPLLLQTMSHRHKAVIELALQGKSRSQIASMLSYTPQAIGTILKQPIVQHEMARLRTERSKQSREDTAIVRQQAKELIETLALQAAQTQMGLLDSKDEKIKLATSIDILNRTYGKEGMSPAGTGVGGSKIRIEVEGQDAVKLFLAALSESGLKSEVVEGEVTSSSIESLPALLEDEEELETASDLGGMSA